MRINPISTLNPRQLAAFRAVIVCGSATGAGKILHVSQPAITRLIKELEIALGFSLFLRRSGGMTPTRDAQILYRDVERYFLGLERVVEAARNLRNKRGGQLRIAAMPTLSSRVLPEAIGRFRERFPEIDVIIESDVSTRILDALAHNEVDLGIGRIPLERDDLDRLDMPVSEAICILPKQHELARKDEISVQDLAGQPFVALGASSLLRLQVEAALRISGVETGSLVQTLFSNTASAYVARGLGIAVVDVFSIMGADLTRIEVRRFRPRIAFDFAAIYPRDDRSPLASAFARELLAVVTHEVEDSISKLTLSRI